jgi:hypothetical protein
MAGARDKEFRFFNIQYSLFTRTKRPHYFQYSIFNIQFSIPMPFNQQSTIINHQSNGVPHYGSPGQGMVLFLIVRLPCSIHEVRSVTHLTGVPIRK